MKHLPKVSSKHYLAAEQQGEKSARVKFKMKGKEDGNTYQGQKLITPCRNCGGEK